MRPAPQTLAGPTLSQETIAPIEQAKEPAMNAVPMSGKPSGFGGGAPRRPQNAAPQIDSLKTLISGVERKTAKQLSPNERDNVAKTLMEDLKGGGASSFRDALEQAKTAPPAENKPAGGAGPSIPPMPPKSSGDQDLGNVES